MTEAEQEQKEEGPKGAGDPFHPLVKAGFVLALIPAVLLGGFALSSCVAGRSAARSFLAALSERRFDDARALLSVELQADLEGAQGRVPDGDPGRTLALVWASRSVRYDSVTQSGFSNDLVPFGCYEGERDDAKRFWIVMRKLGGAWRVVDLRSTEPEICHGD